MNSKQEVSHYLRKPGRHDYESQFALQSKKGRGRASKQLGQRNSSSRAVQSMGGESVLDVLVACFAERITFDQLLQEVYFDLSTNTLTQIMKDLLLLSLDDGFIDLATGTKKAVYSQQILQHHVRLGLMEREEYFDRLMYHLDNVLTHDCQIRSLDAAMECRLRLEATRNLLYVTKEHSDQRWFGRKQTRLSFVRGLTKRVSLSTKNKIGPI